MSLCDSLMSSCTAVNHQEPSTSAIADNLHPPSINGERRTTRSEAAIAAGTHASDNQDVATELLIPTTKTVGTQSDRPLYGQC